MELVALVASIVTAGIGQQASDWNAAIRVRVPAGGMAWYTIRSAGD